jgi:hypothetical protein
MGYCRRTWTPARFSLICYLSTGSLIICGCSAARARQPIFLRYSSETSSVLPPILGGRSWRPIESIFSIRTVTYQGLQDSWRPPTTNRLANWRRHSPTGSTWRFGTKPVWSQNTRHGHTQSLHLIDFFDRSMVGFSSGRGRSGPQQHLSLGFFVALLAFAIVAYISTKFPM